MKYVFLLIAVTLTITLISFDTTYSKNHTIRTNSNDFIWPTDASRKITSSFAEYRSTHFHGGIDISTNGQKGYNVYAVSDGYVYRVQVSPHGYGKKLFIRHTNGYFSTYAHLDRFNDAITRFVREEQYKQGTYSVSITLHPNQLSVKKGEVIAYTGETGVGPPHLHFEIRDENLNPVNPISFEKNFLTTDNIPPYIKRIVILPLDFHSFVDKSSSPKYFSRFSKKKDLFIIPNIIHINGKIGIGVDVLDRSDSSWSKVGIHRLEFYLNDSLAFALQFDRIPANETKQILLHYDLPSLLTGKGKFQKLYREVGNILPFYEHRPEGSGIISTENLAAGIHTYRIICRDIGGNESRLEGKFLVNHKPVIEIETMDEDEIVLSGKNLTAVSKCILLGKTNSNPSWSKKIIHHKNFSMESSSIKLQVKTSQYDIIKVIAETEAGVQSAPAFYFKTKPVGEWKDIQIEIQEKPNTAKIIVSTNGIFTQKPQITFTNGYHENTIGVEPINLSSYVGVFTPSDSSAGLNTIKIEAEVNGQAVNREVVLDSYIIPARYTGYFTTAAGLAVSYDSGAVFAPLFLKINKEVSNNQVIYQLSPQDVLINNGITFSVPVPSNAESNKLGLYFRTNGGWRFQTRTVDTNRQTFSTTLTRTLGELALFQDDTPPSIGQLKVVTRNGRVFIQFRYNDNLSGVNSNEIKLYIDDKLVIPEIDGEHRRVWYHTDEKLEKGKHTLKIIAKDMMNNSAEISRLFVIQ